MDTPLMTAPEERQYGVFTALMWALSYPGRLQRLPAAGRAALLAVGETLVDLETSFYSPDAGLAAELAHTGGRARPPELAAYQFYPHLDGAALAAIERAPLGSYVEPEAAATLVIACPPGVNQTLVMRGPGINGLIEAHIGGLPEPFWALRARLPAYPLGWDCFLLLDDMVLGLPRTTILEVH